MITRRSFLGATLVGIAPLMGCGGGDKQDTRTFRFQKKAVAFGVTPSGKYIPASRNIDGNGYAWLFTNSLDLTDGIDVHPSEYKDSALSGISDDGKVGFIHATNASGESTAFLWKNGKHIRLLPEGYRLTTSWISGDGRIQRAGIYKPGKALTVEWRGTMQSMVELPQYFGYPSADGSIAVLDEGYKATLSQSGVKRSLHPETMKSSSVRGISRNGEFQVGSSISAADEASWYLKAGPTVYSRATVWNNSAESARFLHPEGWHLTEATHINNNGRVIGGSGYQTQVDRNNGLMRALLWLEKSESMIDLHALLPRDINFRDSDIRGMDEHGNIVGYASDHEYNIYIVYWTAF
ncbi:MAG: hypothetical protein QM758_28620 [Armatimonas sp.]